MSGNTRSDVSDDRQEGFTLVELLMAIAITGIILVTLGFAVTEGFRNTTTTKISIDRSILANLATRYFTADVASATYGASSIVTTNAPVCGSGTAAIDIQTSATTVVSYSVVTGSDGRRSLIRGVCTGTVAGPLAQPSLQHLGTTDGTLAAAAQCATSTSCAMTLSWTAPSFSVTVSGTRWVNATTTTSSP